MLGGIVLAAGEGRRMGGAKALLLVEGRPLVWWHVRRLLDAGCSHVTVVAQPHRAALIREQLNFESVDVIAAATKTQSDSLAVALQASRADTLFITPIDLFPAELATLRRLREALSEVDACTPQFNGTGGHPVAISRSCLSSFDGTQSLHDVLRLLGARRRRLAVDDAAVLGDFDTPADFAAPVSFVHG